MLLQRLQTSVKLLEQVAKWAMVAWLVAVGMWVYSLRSFAKTQIVSIQNRQMTIALFSDLKDAESGQRGYLLTHDEAYLPQYVTAVRLTRADFRILKQYLSDRPTEQKTLALLNVELSSKLDELEKTVSMGKAGRWEEAMAFVKTGDGLHTMERIRDLFDVLAAQERDVIRKQQAGML